MKIAVIFNSYAANGKANKYKESLLNEFESAGLEYELFITDSKEDAIATAGKLDFNLYKALVAAGGDGTLFNVVNGYMLNKSQSKIPLGIIPVGTGNAFARDLNLISNNIKVAVNTIRKGNTKFVDIGKFTTGEKEFYFVNIIGLGFVTDVARSAHKLKFLGGLSYTLGVLYHTLYLKPFSVNIIHDGKEIQREVIFLEISNTRYTGKDFLMAPAAKIDDGLFDITIMNKSSRLRLLSGLPKIFKGEHINMKEVESIKASSIIIKTDTPKVLTPDGEIMGTTPLEIKCLPKALEFFINEN
jgi:YegS/Rv2252/BmrU family lipid kinase